MTLLFTPLAGDPGPSVNLPSLILYQFTSSKPCYAGIRFGADGDIYEKQFNGGWSRVGTWLLSGSAANFYISRSIDSGTLAVDAGAGPLQMNANRDYTIIEPDYGSVTEADVTFEISNDVSGSPILVTEQYGITAELF